MQQQQQQHVIVVTGLPPEGLTEDDVRQYLTSCGDIDSIFLFLASQMPTTSPSAAPPTSSAALVCFKNASSVAYAELLSGSVFKGKVIQLKRPAGAGAEGELFNSKTAADALRAELNASEEFDKDFSKSMTGWCVRARMRRAAKAMQAKAGQLASGTHENMAKAKQGALAMQLSVRYAVTNAREMRARVPLDDKELTAAQYDYTPTQPQWGEKSA
ncbi:hypothetical protein ABB37_05618 [Leptomonas pyrrhocoris]|uniref:RRM domain-containing protein n=1 Tax=Leptomonas pyrrhocoris TaxID=157538 RepID=A0A0M9FZH4_LEPPY|nr:hypothetical protein ABB37_05618 [Leptomonas pyrrhocoris]XP_015657533.1 hypothetical protein ABB37_05618 [Leptomonas pyrrhocoris]XP_015657534.1 hypothetical protein ABB37_05618 [Leptomonas pyrrhocoris]XP_015657535.1 hypothetical protein ABB37_05618 [Leptomonas pyrrhocoris]XP_015657536.1 hypothetical protein ABB37_05618 [Leptomonas pyrrhocoris]KPA79093.1 hypothetical protein ABB37_05618 [Leptomonas pyrrhocoris]KPA79094.1 hypothetical protein ABB37_05618 [Leptomonas pyrrhocoris]KPA79095.1 h|eukprot:XP_015657532.1 hypothetical protein ABB37_05618 [Leptomonas pyrrhocoris]